MGKISSRIDNQSTECSTVHPVSNEQSSQKNKHSSSQPNGKGRTALDQLADKVRSVPTGLSLSENSPFLPYGAMKITATRPAPPSLPQEPAEESEDIE